MGMARALVEHHAGRVPSTMEALVELPGVGRKTANVVLGHALGIPGLPVDRHVLRVSNRIGIASSEDPVEVEQQLGSALPPAEWTTASDTLILHGRRICKPKPLCDQCVVRDDCDFYRTLGERIQRAEGSQVVRECPPSGGPPSCAPANASDSTFSSPSGPTRSSTPFLRRQTICFWRLDPGAGILTLKLAPRVSRLIAIEIDRDLIAELTPRLPSNASIVSGDVLDIDLDAAAAAKRCAHSRCWQSALQHLVADSVPPARARIAAADC